MLPALEMRRLSGCAGVDGRCAYGTVRLLYERLLDPKGITIDFYSVGGSTTPQLRCGVVDMDVRRHDGFDGVFRNDNRAV